MNNTKEVWTECGHSLTLPPQQKLILANDSDLGASVAAYSSFIPWVKLLEIEIRSNWDKI